MTISELYEKAQALSPDEREELAKLLMESVQPQGDWTDEELEELLKIEPMTGAEIVAAGLTGKWENENLPDGGDWRDRQQKLRRESRKW